MANNKFFVGAFVLNMIAEVSIGSPIIIGHRGASGERPEHTLEAYELAIDQGADFIEPDLVITKDKVLIARHENEISQTTNVADKFPTRKTTKKIDNKDVTGWFTEDFTLVEIKTLKARERLPFRDQTFNDKFEIPTFKEILQFIRSKNKKIGREVGIYPETKHPTYFQSLNLALEAPLISLLSEFGYDKKTSKVFIQSFEVSNLKALRTLTKVPLVQLLDDPEKSPYDSVVEGKPIKYLDMASNQGLKDISKYADGVGPYKRFIFPEGPDGKLQAATGFIKAAHANGLQVHTWTLRREPQFLHKDYGLNFGLEFLAFFKAGIDGVFTDFPAEGVKAVKEFKTNSMKKGK